MGSVLFRERQAPTDRNPHNPSDDYRHHALKPEQTQKKGEARASFFFLNFTDLKLYGLYDFIDFTDSHSSYLFDFPKSCILETVFEKNAKAINIKHNLPY
jgi:hypothetical protein